MSLEQDILAALGPGRLPVKVEAEIVREITDADIARLVTTPAGTAPQEIKKITERHHMVARLLAAGTPEGEVAIITGYTLSRVSVLKGSPAMQELIALYKKAVDTEFVAVFDHLAGLSKDALTELRERLETEPEKFSNKQLLEVLDATLDRTGHPRAKEVKQEVNVNIRDKLDAARIRARRAAQGEIIEADYKELLNG